MTFEEIEAIVLSLDGRGIDRVELTVGAARLTLRFGGDTAPVGPSPLAAPSPGRFRPRHPLEAGPRFLDGEAVHTGDVVAFVEANGLLLPVLAAADLTLGPPLVADGAAVGWGTALYETR